MIFIWDTPITASIEQIIEDLRAESGLMKDINDTGNDLMVTCPFHKGGEENKPSCGISKQEVRRGDDVLPAGTVHCYSCGYKGGLPKFVADVLNLDNKVAGFRWLLEHYNYGAGDSRDLNLDLERDEEEDELKYIPRDTVVDYNINLLESDRAQDYIINERGIDLEVALNFKVGYNPDNDSIVFPAADREEQVVMVKERSIEGKKFYNTVGSEKAGVVYGLHMVEDKLEEDNQQVWICESEIDVLTLWGWNELAVSIMGSHISDKQVEELAKSRIRHIRNGLDNDEAGKEGWRKMKDTLIPKGFRLWNTDWSEVSEKGDINELTKNEFDKLERY